MTMTDKELELEAEKLRQNQYIDGSITTWTKNDWQSCWKEGFIAGATSKYVEKQKLEFAIEQLKRFRESTFGKGVNVIQELEQKLKEYE